MRRRSKMLMEKGGSRLAASAAPRRAAPCSLGLRPRRRGETLPAPEDDGAKTRLGRDPVRFADALLAHGRTPAPPTTAARRPSTCRREATAAVGGAPGPRPVFINRRGGRTPLHYVVTGC